MLFFITWGTCPVRKALFSYGQPIFILFFIGVLFGKSDSTFYPDGFSRLNLRYRVPNKGYFWGFVSPLGTKGEKCENVNVQWHIFTYTNSVLLPGFFGIKGNFTKFSIFKAFFVLFYCSMTSVALSKGYFSYY